MDRTPLRDFLEIPYEGLEQMNLESKRQRLARVPIDQVREERRKYLVDERRIKAVTVCFTDLEGRFHMLDYDKKFLLSAADNLTFDGSSVRGFSQQAESDLRLTIDWASFYWLPADVFGPGKVLVFGQVEERDGTPYHADMRSRLKALGDALFTRDGTIAHASNEIEGFLFKGRDAERQYPVAGQFEFISTGGYYHSLPGDTLRRFIDCAAEVQRALGFANEKDHPEVAPSQFEMNYAYTEACVAADQVQLYKLICRQVAQMMDLSACFLPKPVTGVNGSGMHTNLSLTRSGGNLFWDAHGEDHLSTAGWNVVDRILTLAPENLSRPQLERERLPPVGPAFRGTEPDQGVGHRPGRDDPDPARQREVRPHRGAVDRPRREPVPRHLRPAAGWPRGSAARGHSRRRAKRDAFPAGQHLRRDRLVRVEPVHGQRARRTGPPEVCRREACPSRPLSQGARVAHQDGRSAVPPRGDEPVSVEPVLTRGSGTSGAFLRGNLARRLPGQGPI